MQTLNSIEQQFTKKNSRKVINPFPSHKIQGVLSWSPKGGAIAPDVPSVESETGDDNAGFLVGSLFVNNVMYRILEFVK